MTLFETVFSGNDAVYGLTENAINAAIEQHGAAHAGGHAAPDVFALYTQHTRWKGGKSLWRVCRLIPATLPTN